MGFGYQLAFVRLLNRFPNQQPLEVIDDMLSYVSVQLGIPIENISEYSKRQPTISEHQEQIREYLGLARLSEAGLDDLKQFIFEEASRLEQTSALLARTTQFLKDKGILIPSEDTLERFIVTQREVAKKHIYGKILEQLPDQMRDNLDGLLETADRRQSEFNGLKEPPLKPSPFAVNRLTEKIDRIESTGVMQVDLSWLNNNLQRTLSHQGENFTAAKLRGLVLAHRYAIMVCFLQQHYRDTIDYLVDMFDKLINRIYNSAQNDIDTYNKTSAKQVKKSLSTLQVMAELFLDDNIEDSRLRQTFFEKVGREELLAQMKDVKTWLSGKHSHVFNLVRDRFSYIRQFSPSLLKHLKLEADGGTISSLIQAIEVLKEMNDNHKRRLPDDAPIDFIPKKIVPMVEIGGNIDKRAWESALLTAIRDEIKAGNLSVSMSKRFGRFDNFFIPYEKWENMKEGFFRRAGLPADPHEAADYLTKRLDLAFDQFLETLPENTYASIEEKGWKLSVDPTEKLDTGEDKKLYELNQWLSGHMRVVKLPQVLIEVDNAIRFTRFFLPATKQVSPGIDDISAVLVTIMAHGCNIGPYTMSHMAPGVSYSRIKHITEWMLTEESQRSALASIVNAISRLDITKIWGKGRTSSSDGQRFAFRSKVLHQTYSTKFNDLLWSSIPLWRTILLHSIQCLSNVRTEMPLLSLTAFYTMRLTYPCMSIIQILTDTPKTTSQRLRCWAGSSLPESEGFISNGYTR
ncbi:MAG: Tn3 transposase DDE domain protein [Syntrophorhabdus sp. PtaU1.Bin002]|nr:MAG: Tn3 transposase DDE domain protein [Syntrophorhabdus sp. PtaU1.Bin002]